MSPTRMTGLDLGPPEMTEADLQHAIEEAARTFGWEWNHHRPTPAGRTGNRYTTATTVPLPDLTLWHPQHGLIWRELKVPKGAGGRILDSQWTPAKHLRHRTLPGQREVLTSLRAAGADVDVWTPADLRSGLIDHTLTGGTPITYRDRPFPFTLPARKV